MAQLLFSFPSALAEPGLFLPFMGIESLDDSTITITVETSSIYRKRRPIMRNNRKIQLVGLALTILLFLFTAAPAMAGEMTLVGEVNDNYQLVSNGQIYEIADTPKGNELAENFISVKVKVTGTVVEENDMKTLTVSAFEVMSE
jgi:hypothetical protein